jgi:hypothetical protein
MQTIDNVLHPKRPRRGVYVPKFEAMMRNMGGCARKESPDAM